MKTGERRSKRKQGDECEKKSDKTKKKRSSRRRKTVEKKTTKKMKWQVYSKSQEGKRTRRTDNAAVSVPAITVNVHYAYAAVYVVAEHAYAPGVVVVHMVAARVCVCLHRLFFYGPPVLVRDLAHASVCMFVLVHANQSRSSGLVRKQS